MARIQSSTESNKNTRGMIRTMEKTERCKHVMNSVPIIKGNKVIGINHYCTRPNCHHEYDEQTRQEKIYGEGY